MCIRDSFRRAAATGLPAWLMDSGLASVDNGRESPRSAILAREIAAWPAEPLDTCQLVCGLLLSAAGGARRALGYLRGAPSRRVRVATGGARRISAAPALATAQACSCRARSTRRFGQLLRGAALVQAAAAPTPVCPFSRAAFSGPRWALSGAVARPPTRRGEVGCCARAIDARPVRGRIVLPLGAPVDGAAAFAPTAEQPCVALERVARLLRGPFRAHRAFPRAHSRVERAI
eukprot:13760639-Alexandrium_andersonii.AAC.1